VTSIRWRIHWKVSEVERIIPNPARTVTAIDSMDFARLSDDLQRVESNWNYSATAAFGGPIAHGALLCGNTGESMPIVFSATVRSHRYSREGCRVS
jgi:acyl dehydratase